VTSKKKHREMPEQGLGEDPLGDSIADSDPLVQHFYQQPAVPAPKRQRAKGRQPLKDGRTWRLVTFSFYEEDVARLDALLMAAKKKGHKRVSRSQIVRLALRNVDLTDLPEVV